MVHYACILLLILPLWVVILSSLVMARPFLSLSMDYPSLAIVLPSLVMARPFLSLSMDYPSLAIVLPSLVITLPSFVITDTFIAVPSLEVIHRTLADSFLVKLVVSLSNFIGIQLVDLETSFLVHF